MCPTVMSSCEFESYTGSAGCGAAAAGGDGVLPSEFSKVVLFEGGLLFDRPQRLMARWAF